MEPRSTIVPRTPARYNRRRRRTCGARGFIHRSMQSPPLQKEHDSYTAPYSGQNPQNARATGATGGAGINSTAARAAYFCATKSVACCSELTSRRWRGGRRDRNASSAGVLAGVGRGAASRIAARKGGFGRPPKQLPGRDHLHRGSPPPRARGTAASSTTVPAIDADFSDASARGCFHELLIPPQGRAIRGASF